MIFKDCDEKLTEERLVELQARLGLRFPQSLKNYYIHANGGYPEPNVYEDEEDEYVGATIDQCFPLTSTSRTLTAVAVYEDQILKKKTLPRHFFPFAIDPGGNILYVDCSSADGMVFLYHHDTAFDPVVPFNIGLDEFWSRLKADV